MLYSSSGQRGTTLTRRTPMNTLKCSLLLILLLCVPLSAAAHGLDLESARTKAIAETLGQMEKERTGVVKKESLFNPRQAPSIAQKNMVLPPVPQGMSDYRTAQMTALYRGTYVRPLTDSVSIGTSNGPIGRSAGLSTRGSAFGIPGNWDLGQFKNRTLQNHKQFRFGFDGTFP